MEASAAARAAGRPASQLRVDPNESRLAERVIAVARAVLAMTTVIVFRLDPPAPSRFTDATDTILFGYLAFALLLLLLLIRVKTIPRLFPVAVHSVDIAFAGILTLSSAGVDSPLFTFLLYPLLAAAYRWGFREVMSTAVVVDGVMGLEAILLGESAFELNTFLIRAIYVVAMGAAVGFLAENEKRRRLETRDIAVVLGRAGSGGKLSDTVNLVLTSIRRVFGASEVLVAVREQKSGRAWLWSAGDPDAEGKSPRAEALSAAEIQNYFFTAPGVAWHAVATLWPTRGHRFSVVAVDDDGDRVRKPALVVPDGFLAAHPCRRMIGASLELSDEWSGRLFVVAPSLGTLREQSARFAMRLAKQVAPSVYGQYLVRRLRSRAEALERGRIARELHDGVTQSLLGLEMELVVLHRRAMAQAPQLADDLTRVHGIVRNEVITVRELMEGIRVGDGAAGDLPLHLGEVVERFGRYTGTVARFISEGPSVAFSPNVGRQIARIVHEALVNVRKHSNASRVTVRTNVEGTCWKLYIEDDGKGFPFAGRKTLQELEALRQAPRTIAERVRIIGGTLSVESRPGFGSVVEVAVPLQGTQERHE
jgi:signal transduction histidine kinase